MRRAHVVWLVAGLSCASPPAPAAVPAPAPADTTAPVLLPPAMDLTGGWATGSVNEPPAGAVVLHPACTYHPPVWIIEQSGNVLRTWAFPATYDQGIARRDDGMARVSPSLGTISGADVVIADGDTRWALRYDSLTGHLRGTRNGQPFWAARQVAVRVGACPGVP